MAKRAWALTVSVSVDGTTKMRATTSLSSPWAVTMGATVATSSADSQLMMAPSPSRPARFSMPSRSAATRIGTSPTTGVPRRKPDTANVP